MNGQKENFSEENGENGKILGLDRNIFFAAAAGALLVLVLVIVVIATRTGGGEKTESEGALPSENEEASAYAPLATLPAPDLVGRTWSDELAQSISPIRPIVIYDPGSDAPKGQIVAQHPAPDTTLYCDDDGICRSLEITVSSRDFSTNYQSLVGVDAEDAMQRLAECGVKKENVFRVYKASTTGVGNGCVSSFTYDNGGEVPEGAELKDTDKFTMTINSYSDSVPVPALGGKSFEQAVELLYKSKLNVGEISYRDSGFEDGTVLSQTPADGEAAYYGDKVDLVLSKRTDGFEMPSLLGLTLEEAEELLKSRGLTLGSAVPESTRDYAPGVVCGQSVNENDTVYADTVIDVKVAAGGKADENVDWDADPVFIDLSENTHLSAGTLERIAELEGKRVFASAGDKYVWTLPTDAKYPQGDEGLDLGLAIGGAEEYGDAAEALTSAGYADFVIISRESEQSLPNGLEVSVSLGAELSGRSVVLYRFDEGTKKLTEVSGGALPVSENGYAVFAIREKGVYAAALAEEDVSEEQS